MRAAIYCRVSTSKQEEDGTSLDTQEERCRQYAREHKYEVSADHVYREVYTGGELYGRPKMSELRHEMQHGALDAVIFYATDRLTRTQIHLGVIVGEADHYGVKLLCVTQEFDDSSEGQVIRTLLAFAAEKERMQIRERTIRGQRARVASGKPMPGSRPPYGYKWEDKDKSRLVLDPLTAPIVRRLFETIVAGQTARNLAAQLTEEGVPTPTGRMRWSVPTITGIIRKPVYTGNAAAFRYTTIKNQSGRSVMVMRPTSEHQPLIGVAPAIVSTEVAAAASTRLTQNRSTSRRRNADPEAALLRGGYARCGYCDRAAIALNTTDRGTLYRCNQANRDRYGCRSFGLRATEVDNAVWERIEARLRDPGIIQAEVARFLRTLDANSEDLTAVERQLSELERRQQLLAKRLATTEDDDVAGLIQAEMTSLAKQARQLRTDQEALARLRQEQNALKERLADLSAWCRNVAENIDELTYDQRRLALDALGVEVRLWAKGDRNPPWEIQLAPVTLSPSSCF